jgi:ribA/ribD-fused uncharacterized protein
MEPVIDRFSGPRHAFLSNFHLTCVEFEGINYPSLEHAFQAAKTESLEERIWILQSASPGIAKHRGRRVTLREDWEQVKLEVMLNLLRQKFGPKNPGLQRRLLETLPAKLVEGNTWGDTFWGVSAGVGKNWLGVLLMQVREEIRHELPTK